MNFHCNYSHFIHFVLLGILILILSGCATVRNMTLPNSNYDTSKESLLLLSIKASNQISKIYTPEVILISLQSTKTGKKIKFRADKNIIDPQTKEGFQYVSMSLPQGSYKIMEVEGGSGIFPVSGSFKFPLSLTFTVSPNAIQYLGRMTMVNRKAKSGEKHSGSIFPLIDQAATGFATGTLDIAISDENSEDLKSFKADFPELKNFEILTTLISTD
jgi:hypothetical protein